MNENNQYIKFMSDIIDSGVWAELSAGAKTLYPVLLKFSDQNFKQVWPSTKTLMKYTGFKTKKSIIDAKKDLINAGLIQVKQGTGHSNSIYYFCFNYKGSKIKPQWNKKLDPRDIEKDTTEEKKNPPSGLTRSDSNQINITITNNNQNHGPKNKSKKEKPSLESNLNLQSIIETYGLEIFNLAYSKALEQGLQNDLEYIKNICKEKSIHLKLKTHEHKPDYFQSNWLNFLSWASTKLSNSSLELLKKIEPVCDGNVIYIKEQVPNLLKEVIQKYFKETSKSSIFVLFENECDMDSRV